MRILAFIMMVIFFGCAPTPRGAAIDMHVRIGLGSTEIDGDSVLMDTSIMLVL